MQPNLAGTALNHWYAIIRVLQTLAFLHNYSFWLQKTTDYGMMNTNK